MITVQFTPDELANVQQAVEEQLALLEIATEPGEDDAEIADSLRRAAQRLADAGESWFNYRVRVTATTIGDGRYNGRTGTIVGTTGPGGKTVVQLDRWDPKHETPDGRLYLAHHEYEQRDA